MNLRSDKRQNVQGELDFSSPPAGKAREARREETESPSAMHDPESPARTNRLMEEICERENLKQALQQVRRRWNDRRRNHRLPEAALASDPTTTAEWDLRAETGEAGGNPQAGRRGAKAWYPNGAGSIDPASGDAGSAEAVGLDVLRPQLRFSTGTIRASSSGPGTAVHGPGLRLGG